MQRQRPQAEPSNPSSLLVGTLQGFRNPRDVRIAGNHAYLADFSSTTADLKVINISDPSNPSLEGQSNATNTISDLDLSNNTLYAADGSAGLRILDVRTPSAPVLKSTYNSPGDAQDVKILGNYAYIADGTEGLKIIDIRQPNSPVLKGTAPAPVGVTGVKGTVSAVDVVGNNAYVISSLRQSNSGELQIFSLSNPASPVKRGKTSFSIATADLLHSIEIVGQYAYVAAGSKGLKIIDISNPDSPVLKGEYIGSRTASALDVQVSGNHAYVAYDIAGLDIVDISNPSKPVLAANYDPKVSIGGLNYEANVTSVEVVENYAYLSVRANKDQGGLWILDVSSFSDTASTPTVTLAVSPSRIREDSTDSLTFTFTRTGPTSSALSVNYTAAGSAKLGEDYGGLAARGSTQSVLFAKGSATATVSVTAKADLTVEADETVALTLASGTGYRLGTSSAITGTIANDDVSATITTTLAAGEASLRLLGRQAINGTGNALNNTITGNSAGNRLTGRTGADVLTGGGNTDRDVFAYASLNESLLGEGNGFDQITDFNPNDRISAPLSVKTKRLTSSQGNASALTATAIATLFTRSTFAAHAVAAFRAKGYEGTFIAMNDQRAGYQASSDSIIFLQNYTIGTTKVVEFT
jgi:hypothetical protein